MQRGGFASRLTYGDTLAQIGQLLRHHRLRPGLGYPPYPRWFSAAVAILLLLAFTGNAYAQDHQHHHPLHMDFYQHWRDPSNPSLSCCNARVEKDGVEVGDCEPSRAEVRNGMWWVWIRQTREWLMVPDAKIIREKNPNTFDAHICWTPLRGVICFVPPDTGG